MLLYQPILKIPLKMNKHFYNTILKATGASDLYEIEVIQNLWSGYGEIVRVGLHGSELEKVVIKHVQLEQQNHPRGWNTNLSHERKLKSYKVETAWYKNFAKSCSEECRIPDCLALDTIEGEVLMVLEDLDASGFSGRRTGSVTWDEVFACLKWLALLAFRNPPRRIGSFG